MENNFKLTNAGSLSELFKDLMAYLVARWWVLLLVGLMGGIVGVTYAWLKKPKYVAELSFSTEEQTGGGLSAYAGIAAQFGLDLGGNSKNIFTGDNVIELMKSQSMLRQTLLTKAADEKGKPQLLIQRLLQYHTLVSKEDMVDLQFEYALRGETNRAKDSIIKVVIKWVGKEALQIVRKDKKLNIIQVKMTTGNELLSKQFVEILTNNTLSFYTKYRTEKALKNVQIIQFQADSVKALITGNVMAAAVLSDLNINPTMQRQKVPLIRRQADVEINKAVYTELIKNLEPAKLALRRETPLFQVIDVPILPLEKIKPGRFWTGLFCAITAGIFALLYYFVIFYRQKISLQFNQTSVKT